MHPAMLMDCGGRVVGPAASSVLQCQTAQSQPRRQSAPIRHQRAAPCFTASTGVTQRHWSRQRHHACSASRHDTAVHADTEPAMADDAAALERQMQASLAALEREDPDNSSAPSSSGGAGASDASTSAAAGEAADEKFAGRRMAVLQATKRDAVNIRERDRSLGEYMTLPASQYSVLDAKRIERIDDDTFRCYVGGISFLNFKVEPVLTVSVVVGRLGPTVSLLQTKLEGSRAVRNINDRFTATMTNRVRWRDASEDASPDPLTVTDAGGPAAAVQPGSATGTAVSGPSLAVNGAAAANPDSGLLRQITSDTEIKVTLQVPGWLLISENAISRTGSMVMQKVLNTMVPRFLAQLAADYELWAAGDASRKPIGTGQL